jgi:radical SAM superfamily enzyme YgiQ (UPF0313 family)
MPSDVLLAFASTVLLPYAQPYGVTIVRAHLERRRITVVTSLPFQSLNPMNRFRHDLERASPTIVGISYRNLDSAGFAASEQAYTFDPRLREMVTIVRGTLPEALVVLGGSGFTADPYRILDDSGADLGFLGTSETVFAEFVERYMRQAERRHARRIAVAFPACVVRGEVSQPAVGARIRPVRRLPLSDDGVPVRLHDQALDFASVVGGTVPIRTKTGCSLRCSYCVVPYIERLVLRPIEHVIRDFEHAVSVGKGREIFVADAEFNLPDARHAEEICEALARRLPGELEWRCYVCPSAVDRPLVAAMHAAGCRNAGLAVDSLDRVVRQRMGKRCEPEVAESSVGCFIDSGIMTVVTLLFGAPGETIASVRETCARARRLHDRGAQLSITVGLRVYPNTPLALQVTRFPGVLDGAVPVAPIYSSPVDRLTLEAIVRNELPNSDRITWTESIETDRQRQVRLFAHVHDLAWHGQVAEALAVLDRDMPSDPIPPGVLLRAKVLRRAGRTAEAAALLRDLDRQLAT